MNENLLERLSNVFWECFNDDSITLTPATTAADIDGWDSIAHIALMYSIEEEFGVAFMGNELGEFRDVGELLEYLGVHARS